MVFPHMKTYSKQRVALIAEDEAYTSGILQFHLRKRGYRTLVAKDGIAALEILFATQPDLLILDSMLPNLHGYEICALIKEEPETCHIPIMILMPRPGIEDETGDFILGADDYLVKPFDVREFLARVAVLEEQSSFEERALARRRNLKHENPQLVCDEE